MSHVFPLKAIQNKLRQPITWVLPGLLAFFVAWVLMVFCVGQPPAHACCQQGTANHHDVATVLPCCLSSTAVAVPASDPPIPPALTFPFSAIVFNFSKQLPHESTLLASDYIPDQSQRYLDLRILLN